MTLTKEEVEHWHAYQSEPTVFNAGDPIRERVLALIADRDATLRRAEAAEARAAAREPTRDEMEAALGDKDEAFLGGTVRRCIDCRTPIFGGPTRCLRCAGRYEMLPELDRHRKSARAWEHDAKALASERDDAVFAATSGHALGCSCSWCGRLRELTADDATGVRALAAPKGGTT